MRKTDKIVLDFSPRRRGNLTQETRKVSVARGEKLIYVLVFLDGESSRDLTVELAEEGAEAQILGLFWGGGKATFKIKTAMVHRAPRTRGETFVRGVLTDSAQADFRGLIKIEKGAVKSEDFLTENTLLLSPRARADSVPSLEIEADDVRASHAATMGRLDTEQVFYLMSRGLDQKQAEKLIVSGFFQPILEKLPKDIQEKVSRKLKKKQEKNG